MTMSMGQGPGGQGPPGQSGGGPPGQAGGAGTAGVEGGAAASTGIAGRRVGAGTIPDEREATGAPGRRGIETADEPLGSPDQPEFELFAEFGGTATTNTSLTEMLDVAPSRGRTLLLDQVVVESTDNASVRVTVSGQTFRASPPVAQRSWSPDGAKLPYGGHIRGFLRSENGELAQAVIQIVGREV